VGKPSVPAGLSSANSPSQICEPAAAFGRLGKYQRLAFVTNGDANNAIPGISVWGLDLLTWVVGGQAAGTPPSAARRCDKRGGAERESTKRTVLRGMKSPKSANRRCISAKSPRRRCSTRAEVDLYKNIEARSLRGDLSS